MTSSLNRWNAWLFEGNMRLPPKPAEDIPDGIVLDQSLPNMKVDKQPFIMRCVPDHAPRKALIGSAVYRQSKAKSCQTAVRGKAIGKAQHRGALRTDALGEENKRFQFRMPPHGEGTVSGAQLGNVTKRYVKFFHGTEVEYRLVSVSSFSPRASKLRDNIADISRKLAKATDAATIAKLRSLRQRQLDALSQLISNHGGII